MTTALPCLCRSSDCPENDFSCGRTALFDFCGIALLIVQMSRIATHCFDHHKNATVFDQIPSLQQVFAAMLSNACYDEGQRRKISVKFSPCNVASFVNCLAVSAINRALGELRFENRFSSSIVLQISPIVDYYGTYVSSSTPTHVH